ncbi:MAG: carboxypeptidase regulatory-like domain-containing protein [Opitutaceae bacterium]|jgi:TonB-dependent receptor|nr:carboxypeptidase regulatory-like domain-containing protein [Opitutaceae bacterium]
MASHSSGQGLYAPTVVPSFGPNATHWPSAIPTPFLYDVTVPHVIEVDCTWTAISNAVKAVSADQASAGVLILVRPGELIGNGGGSSGNASAVLDSIGSAAWTRRVTIAPRDGAGTVTITGNFAKIYRAKGVCFAGLVGTGLFLSGCDRSAVAWSKLGYLYIYAGGQAVDSFELGEVVMDISLWSGDANRISRTNNTNPIRFYSATGQAFTNFRVEGSYVLPLFQNSTSGLQAGTHSVYFEAGPHVNYTFRDTALFASTQDTISVNATTDGLAIDHCYIASGSASTARYPVPDETTTAANRSIASQVAFAGSGQNITVANSIVTGNITTATTAAAQPFASVTNTKTDRAYSTAVQTPVTGAWGAPNAGDITPVEDLITLAPPEPTDSYLFSATGTGGIWGIGGAPIITMQPEAPTGTQAAGIDITLGVAATGKFLFYQWKKDGVDIEGANSATYIISNAGSYDSGNYTVKVSNAAGETESDAAVVSVTGIPLYRPAVVSSFGPNGTHWPTLIPTPFMYDVTVPHVIEVDCTWTAIGTAISGLTDEQANAGVLIRVAPGTLTGNGSGSSSSPVLQNLGKTTWAKRVTIAPRDGFGSVTIGDLSTPENAALNAAKARFLNVKNVCFAGFRAGVILMASCDGSALAWSQCYFLPSHNSSAHGATLVSNVEVVEVVVDKATLFPTRNDTGRDHTASVVALGAAEMTLDGFRFTGCYFAPSFQASAGRSVSSLHLGDWGGTASIGVAKNFRITDCALFGSGIGSLNTHEIDGLVINHSYIVSGDVSQARYPIPEGAYQSGTVYYYKALAGNGKNLSIANSVVAGDINTGATTAAQPWASVTDTQVNTSPAAELTPASGSWGEPVENAALIALMPPEPTDAYLASIWTIAAPVLVTELSATASVDAGDSITLSVDAGDSQFVMYEWKKNDVVIAGATGASHTIENATAEDAGTYSVTVSNGGGSVTSSTTLTVIGAPPPTQLPVISEHPQSATVNAGSAFSLSVTATDPLGGTLTYLWYKDNQAIPGTNFTTIGSAAVTAGDAGSYHVTVTNADGATTSNIAVITVNVPTPDTPPGIPTQPPATRVALEGGSITLTASYTGNPAPAITWQVSTDGGTTWTSITTDTPPYTGAGTASLTIDSVTAAMEGWQYRYTLNNGIGAPATSNATTLTVNTGNLYLPAEIASRGPNGTHWPSNIPTPFMYDITVPHVIEVDCSWEAIQNALAAVTDDMAAAGTLIRVKPGALYANYAGNGNSPTQIKLGNVGSTAWPRRVTIAPRDGYGSVRVEKSETDSAKGSFQIAHVYNVCFAGFSATGMGFRQCDGLAVAWSDTGYLNIFNYENPPEHTANIELAEVFVDAALNPATPDRRRSDGALRFYNGGTLDNVSVAGSYIAAVFYGGSQTVSLGAFNLPSITAVTGNPAPVATNLAIRDTAIFAGTDAALHINGLTDGLTIANSFIAASAVSASRYPVPANAGIPSDLSPGHERAINGRGKNITVAGSVVAGALDKMIGTDAPSGKPFASVTDTRTDRAHTHPAAIPASGAWTVSSPAEVLALLPPEPTGTDVPGSPDPAKIYLKQIWTFPPPVFATALPVSTPATAGTNVTLSVTVQDTTLVVYQWKKDNVIIPGANESSLTLAGITEEDAGLYTVTVSNGGGTIESSTQVTVGEDPAHPLPIITNQPQASVSTPAGTPVSLTVTATNPPPASGTLTYQWFKGGTALTGQTAATLNLAGVPADAGSYTVKVSNANGTRTSAAAVVEVTGTPAGIAVQLPSNKSLIVGENLTLTATVTGNPAPTLQWQYSADGGATWTDIPSATSATLTVTSVTLGMDGRLYRFVATNPFGPVPSNNTALEVLAERRPFPKPAEVSSFGPNGTHWPSLLSTPFLYDITIPHRIEVDCTWNDVRTALQSLTEQDVAEGVLILIRPGALPGYGSGASSTPVLENLGSTAWPRRVTIAPRDGYGTVQITAGGVSGAALAGARIHNVHGICLAGFQASAIRPNGCKNTAIAWMNVTSWIGVSSNATANTDGVEMVEVVLPTHAIADDDSAQVAGSAGSTLNNVQFIGCYIAPHYRANAASHSDTLQFHTAIVTNAVFRDTALFASSNCAIQTGDVQGLTLRHSYLAALAPALSRYPFPSDYTPPNVDDVGKVLNGGGSGFSVYDSILIGRLTGYTAAQFTEVVNTRSTASPGGAGWTVDATLATSTPEDFNIPLPTDAYLDSIWKAIAPAITTQPVGATIGAGGGHTLTVAAEGTITLVYQWYKDNVAIPDATEPAYAITNAGSAASGTYKVVVTNAAGSATSANAEVIVSELPVPPVMEENPVTAQNAIAGQSVSFSVSASGSPAPAYRWQRLVGATWTDIATDDPAYTGADTDTLTLLNPTTAMNGYQYRCIADNGLAAVESTPVTLSVTAAVLDLPRAVVADAAGILYIADAGSHSIWQLFPSGTIQLLAGGTGAAGLVDDDGILARFDSPSALAVRSGTLYVADTGNNAIRALNAAGLASTIVPGDAGLSGPEGIAVTAGGMIYIADTGNQVIRARISDGTLVTIAGVSGSAGATDGPPALFNHPAGLALGDDGTLYVADTGNGAIRIITLPDGAVTTLTASLIAPGGLVVSGTGADLAVYVTDAGDSTLREVDATGAVTLLAGGADDSLKDGTGEAAWFAHPEGLSHGAGSTLYIADTGNAVVRKVTFDESGNAVVTTLKTTVKAPAPPPVDVGPFDPGSDKPGGGGGAPSHWFLAALAALALVRCLRRRCFPLLAVALLFSAFQPFSPSAFAQTTGSVTGRVYKPVTGEYVRDATIRVQSAGLMTTSEADGEYTLSGVPAGEVTVTVSFVGYEIATAQVTVAPGEIVTRDFDLYPLGSRAADGEVVKLDTFVVSGAKEGQSKALQNQKRAATIGEYVASDVFGEVVEGNVGEFLKNLPGIDLEYVEFDARGPRMRGMDPQYVSVTLDGMKLASADAFNATVGTEQAGTDGSRAFGFESISLAAIDAVEVFKNLSANLDADAIAGNINMRSKRAFERKGRRISYGVGISAVSEELRLGQTPGPGDTNRHKARPNFSFEYSDVFLGGKLGVIFNYNHSSIFNEFLSVSNYTVNAPVAGTDPRSVVSAFIFTDGPKISDRTSTSFRVDYKFSPKFSAGVNFMLSDYYAWFDNRQLRLYAYGSPDSNTSRANVVGENPLLAFTTTGGGGYMLATGDSASKFTKTWSIMPSFDWKPTKKLTVEGRFAWSESDNVYKAFADGHIKGTSNLRATGLDFSARRSSLTSSDWVFTQLGGPDWGLLDSYENAWTVDSPRPGIVDEGRTDYNKVLSGSLDATWRETGWALPTFFKAGLKARSDRREFSDMRDWQVWQYYGRGGNPNHFPAGLVSSNPYDLGSHGAAFYSTSVLPPAFIGRTWAYQTYKAHPEYFMHIGDPANPNPPANLVTRYYTAFISNERAIEEEVDAAYVMFGSSWKRLQFQTGVRFEYTRDVLDQWNPRSQEEMLQSGLPYNSATRLATTIPGLQYQYFSKPRQQVVSKDYNHTFLSAALKYDITSDLIFQIGTHQAIARPPLVRIAGTVGYSETNNMVSAPNPGLLPEESDNYSAKLAWYLPDSSPGVLSVGIFQIDVTNKWTTDYFEGAVGSPGDEGYVPAQWNPSDWGVSDEYATWRLATYGNSVDAVRSRGLEFEYRQTLGFLPGEFKNTTAYVNYTRTYMQVRNNAGGTTDQSVKGGVAPHQVNFGVDFRYKRLTLGLSGNWIDDTPWEYSNAGVMTRYRTAEIKYHLNASFKLNNHATLSLSGRNITNAPFAVNYRYNDGRPDMLYRSNIYGALWTLSLKGNF